MRYHYFGISRLILLILACRYFKPKDHYITGRPHGATILDSFMKNETANPTPPPLPSPNHG